MSKKLILHGMEIGKGRLSGLMWVAALFCYSLLLSPLHARAENCSTIDYNITTIAAGGSHTVGLKEDGTVVAVGWNGTGQLNVSDWTNIKAIAAGTSHTVGLKEDGTVVAVGRNWAGHLNVSDWTNIKAIAAGGSHTVGLKEDGTVVAVGDNWSGQLNVSDWTNIKAIAAAAGGSHTVGLKEDGTVVAVGWNGSGQLNVSDWTNIKAIAVGAYHTVGLKEDGTVVAVGGNGDGRLNVSDWTNIKAIAAGAYHTVGLKEDGTVVAVGYNGDGRLNVSDWSNIKGIAVGYSLTVGLKEDGTVVAVGYNGDGQLYVSGWTNIKQPVCLNNAPVADAGPDQVIECADTSGASVTLNGSASSDPDGGSLTYSWAWNGGSAEGINPIATLPLGTTLITLTVSDGKITVTDTVNITIQDTMSPITTATGDSQGWYKTNVISTFSASDSCSGVKAVYYNVNGYETVVAGDSASLTLTADGIYNIVYFAVDNAGNSESPKTMTVKIDKTPPVLNLSLNPNILWPPNHKMVDVLIGGNATDATSGIASVMFSVTDEYGIVQPLVGNFNTTIQLEAWREGNDKDGRKYTITAVATDAAGNKFTAASTVSVPHDQRAE